MEKVENFYEKEEQYEKTTEMVKQLIKKIISINIESLKEKINYVDNESRYNEFIELFIAVIGKKTNKYYYCESEDDVRYHNLVLGQVYRVDDLNDDLKNKNYEEKQINLQGRAILANRLLTLTKQLKDDFSLTIQKKDSFDVNLNTYIIKEKDIEDLENLIKYLETLIDKTGRLKILVAERDVYAMQNAMEAYNKKNPVEKMVYKIFNQEKNIINLMANKNKTKK